MASMAVLLSYILLLICNALFVVLSRGLAGSDSAVANPSNHGSAVWQDDRSPFLDEDTEEYGDEYGQRYQESRKDRQRYNGEFYDPELRRSQEEDEPRYEQPTHRYEAEEGRRYERPEHRYEAEEEIRYKRPEHRYEPEEERSYEWPEKYAAEEEDDHDHRKWRHGARRDKVRRHGQQEPESFVLEDRDFIQQTVISTDAGEMAIILPRDAENEFARRMIGLSILRLEQNALLLPHYTNTHCLFVVYKGKGRISWVNGDEVQEMDLEEGDVYKIESGTLFHLINTDDREMHVFGIHDVAPGSVFTKQLQFHSFFVAGGRNVDTVLSGFDEDVLTAAFNVSGDEVHDILSSQTEKPIVYYMDRNETKQEHPSELGEASGRSELPVGEKPLSTVEPLKSGKQPSAGVSSSEVSSEREAASNKLNEFKQELYAVSNMLLEDDFPRVFEKADANLKEESGIPHIFDNTKKDTPQKPLNILQKKPIFSNEYGATTVADENDFGLLKDVNKGVFSVKLKAGTILAPHWNPRAMEIALVTEGKGEIHIVYPDGRKAFTGRLTKGNIFYVPQNFVMCQIASRDEVLEFIGFSTSSRTNSPQFLAGSNSVLRKLNPSILASSFNVPVEHMQKFLDKQHEVVVLPR